MHGTKGLKADFHMIYFVIGICGERSELEGGCRQFYLFSTPRSNVLFEDLTETPSDPLQKVWYGLSRVEEVFKIFTVIPCILILSKYFIYQLMHKSFGLKVILKFTLKQLLHVSV